MWISNPEELHEILHLLFFGHQTLDPDFNSIKKIMDPDPEPDS